MKVVRKSIVAKSLYRLRAQRTHTLFAGYLYLQKLSSERGRLTDLKPEFLPYFKEFFFVKDHPLGTPYIKLFTERLPTVKNLWLNQNVAGSYAPSSLRPDQPFRKVVDIQGKKYSLPSNHAKRAFKHLLFSMPVSAIDLAIVLYRDFGLSEDVTSEQDLVEIFAYEFGYADQPDSEPSEDFQLLYSQEQVPLENELFETF